MGHTTKVWLALDRQRGKVVAFAIGNTTEYAKQLYSEAKQVVGKIAVIYTDANGMYTKAFGDLAVSHLHCVGAGKAETHFIEAINSSVRDNLARFNRESKRYSKCINMLKDTLLLFFYYKKYNTYKKITL
jgi:IS1 family transposase